MTERKLATIRTITEIRPIPKADAIECAVIDGWTVVIKKGEFSVGDSCVYFEIDSFLPLEDERFAFLGGRRDRTQDGVVGHVLKTIRLRKQLSQGLVLPLAQFPELGAATVGEDVTEQLGLTKWDPPMPADLSGEASGLFPTHLVRKTDSERCQNLTAVWEPLTRYWWTATEKIDGTSITVINDGGTIRVCSRNYELIEHDANSYWQAARAYITDHLAEDTYVQAELYGPGIQGNPLAVGKVSVAIFTYGSTKLPASWSRIAWPDWALQLSVPCYEEPRLPATVQELVEYVDGIRSLINPERLAEGVVYQHAECANLRELGNRATFKAISNKYLLKG